MKCHAVICSTRNAYSNGLARPLLVQSAVTTSDLLPIHHPLHITILAQALHTYFVLTGHFLHTDLTLRNFPTLRPAGRLLNPTES